MRKKLYRLFVLPIALILVAGCTSPHHPSPGYARYGWHEGTVPRYSYQVNYSALLMDFYRSDPRLRQESIEPVAAKIRAPGRVAVAQLGETQAASALLDALRSHPELFTQVYTIPAVPPNLDTFYEYTDHSVSLGGTEKTIPPERAGIGSVTPREWLQQLRLLAADLGSDYLFAYAGSIDFRTKDDAVAKWLDLTLVGQFIIPSEAHTAQGRAIGLLIDTRTNRIVMSVAADSSRKKLARTQYSENTLRDLIGSIRSELQKKIGENFSAEFTRRALQMASS